MKIAMFHYHLNAGGVTRVIENHLRALDVVCGDEPIEVMIIVGNGGNALSPDLQFQLEHVKFSVQTLPLLSYDACLDAKELADAVEETLMASHFEPGDCVLHVHNHALGKNVAWPQALWHLAERGFHMYMQIHDFIEDLRPHNYHKVRGAYANASDEDFIKYLYPQAKHIRYAVLNYRDHAVLKSAGITESRLGLLPNPVFGESLKQSKAEAKAHWAACMQIPEPEHLIVYPVRGITRKNVGEFILHGVVAPEGTAYAITLPPANPIELAHFKRWEQFAQELSLPCYFGVGAVEGLGFEENVAAADAIMTTSVAEGFGMVYLEPWLMGKPVIGRDLPEISADFKQNNVAYQGLYQRLPIPIEWVGEDAFIRQWSNTYAYALRSYGINPPSEDDLAQMARQQLIDETVDFGLLTVDLQRALLRAIAGDPAKQNYVRDFLSECMQVVDEAAIAQNASHINAFYSLPCIGQKLIDDYRTVMQEPGAADFSTLNHVQAVLDGFLDPGRFFPLRVDD